MTITEILEEGGAKVIDFKKFELFWLAVITIDNKKSFISDNNQDINHYMKRWEMTPAEYGAELINAQGNLLDLQDVPRQMYSWGGKLEWINIMKFIINCQPELF